MSGLRSSNVIKFTFPGSTDSDVQSLYNGCFGTLIVDSGSPLIGKTFNIVATDRKNPQGAFYADVPLLLTAKTISVAGPIYFSADEVAQIGAVQDAFIRLSSSVTGTVALLWKG